ncbi:MAG: glycerate kinase [Candidatus Bathyarchaeota archaeon]|nr:glycerate kinase [Candidatus Bathyarchaeota archaeon]
MTPTVFRNRDELLENASSDILLRLRMDALDILEAAVNAVDPGEAVRRNLNLKGTILTICGLKWDLNHFGGIHVIGGGKACGAMAETVEEILGNRISSGEVNVLKGTESRHNLNRISINGASHPIPDVESVAGVKRMMKMLDNVDSTDLVIVLISGGGSSLLAYPAEGIALEDIQDVTQKLLKSGATISEINAVRKHLSAVKGGRLVQRSQQATVIGLILSDVVGDPLDTIASGPTAPDETTFGDARAVLERYGIWEGAPQMVKEHLEEGDLGMIPETPKPGYPIFQRVQNFVIGSNLVAARAAVERARELGYNSDLISTEVEGEARKVGRSFAKAALDVIQYGSPIQTPAVLVAGGETTVSVTGSGVGGRNMEVALAISEGIEDMVCVVAAFATDGIDGPTVAAGAMVDGSTQIKAKARGIDPLKYLSENDSYTFFKSLGDAFITGPTGTNVNDLIIILVLDQEESV